MVFTLGSALLLNLVLALAMVPGGVPPAGQGQSSANTRSPHGSLSIPCQNCHTQSGWKPIRAVPEFDHNTTRYPLRGMHEGVACTQCHIKPVFTNVGKECADCHADIHKRQMGANCEQCHSVKGWHVSVQQINQHLNRFPLIGAHATVDCDSCHKGAAVGQFQGLSTQCLSCHQRDFVSTKSIGLDHVALNWTSCEQCHTMDNWLGAKFDHSGPPANFPLTGAHASLDCSACHAGGKFTLTSASCVSCHLADFNKTNNPPHAQAGFPTTCQQCHNTSAWDPATNFDHNTFTKFPLTGAHTTVACNLCHINGQFIGTPTDCASCHMKDFQGTTNPNHVQSGIPTTCQQCHNTTSWNNATFDHSTTGFPLSGAHTALQCSQCHNTTFSPSGAYNLTSAACVTCHLSDFKSTTAPNHVQSNIPQTCEQCHNTTSWANATFDHSTTGFTLTGAHVALQCAQCHNTTFSPSGAYSFSNGACIQCHLTDYKGTTNPNHVQANFPQTCEQCHNTTNWGSGTFDHSTTGFALTGFHTTLQCAQCHNTTFSPGGAYNLTSTTCVTCHQADYNGTNNPPHAQAGFPTTCQTCHSTTDWTGASFDHTTTGFALTGFHSTMQCTQCHNTSFQGGPYGFTSATTCVTCHQTDYNGTTNPNHAQASFPTTCQQCHNTTNWGNGTFDHTTTGFTLTGFHTTLQCTQCHNTTFSPSGPYSLSSTACITCHQTDYNGTNNPNHAQAGFPTTCQTCHTTTDWTGATFNHSTTGFTLTGFHTTLQCAQCHNTTFSPSGAYNLPNPTPCVTCHLADFNGTNNPSHVQSGFPTTCDQCHTTTNWLGATFNHASTGFTLSGFHATMTCTQCHNTTLFPGGAYTIPNASCIQCHQTDYNGTNAPPHATVGFPTTCDACHNFTNWQGATFNHSTTTFPLTGYHATNVTCAQCHVNNNYTTLPTACDGCHDADYLGTTNPNHTSAGFPKTCDTCHTTTSWAGATFNHTYFPTNHGNANGVCATCHTNPSDYSVFQCTGCHGNNNANNFQHPNVSGYVYNSVNCYQCHKNGSGG